MNIKRIHTAADHALAPSLVDAYEREHIKTPNPAPIEAIRELRIGRSERGHLIIRPTRRPFPELTDFWDGNWVFTTLAVAAGRFRGEVEATLRTTELVGLHEALVRLHDDLSGRVKFEPTEPWLSIDVEGDGKGHFQANCVVFDDLGVGNELRFVVEFDQTDIETMRRDLSAIIEAFPVVGG